MEFRTSFIYKGSMSWKTLVIHDSEKISLFLNSVVVTKHDVVHKFFIGDINCIIIEDYKTILTTRILTKLAESNVIVIVCDEKYNPSAIIQPIEGHYLQLKIIKDQLNWSIQKKRLLWTKITKQKITSQINILKVNNCELAKVEKLYEYIDQVELGDITNREGHAAKVYFNALFGKDFSRDNDNLLINSGLNFGYTILRSAFARTIVAKGLHPSISIFHSNRYDNFALADDLMEPFRPLIDNFVFNNYKNWKHFGYDEKNDIVNLLNTQIEFEGKVKYLTTAINNYVDQIINFMDGENLSQLSFPNLRTIISYEL